jgi:hypothetical protein
MAVGFASIGTQSVVGGYTTSISHSHTIVGNALIVVIEYQGYYGFGAAPGVLAPLMLVSIGGVPLVALKQQNNWAYDGGGSQVSSTGVFGLINPPTGAQTITIATTSNEFYGSIVVDSVSYSNVASFGTVTTSTGTTTTASITTPASAVGNRVFHMFHGYRYNANAGFTAYNQTTRTSGVAAYLGQIGYLLGDAPGSGSAITFSATSAALSYYGVAVELVDLKPYIPEANSLLTTFSTTGAFTYTIPEWCRKLDLILLGGGEAGTDGTLGNGSGGQAGTWVTTTVIRGEDIPIATTTITGTVGAGGTGNGGNGVASTAVFLGAATSFSAAGGSGNMGLFDPNGQGAGTQVYNGQTYVGGAIRNVALGSAGNAPGGGGQGGGLFGSGGDGAAGRVWILAYGNRPAFFPLL